MQRNLNLRPSGGHRTFAGSRSILASRIGQIICQSVESGSHPSRRWRAVSPTSGPPSHLAPAPSAAGDFARAGWRGEAAADNSREPRFGTRFGRRQESSPLRICPRVWIRLLHTNVKAIAARSLRCQSFWEGDRLGSRLPILDHDGSSPRGTGRFWFLRGRRGGRGDGRLTGHLGGRTDGLGRWRRGRLGGWSCGGLGDAGRRWLSGRSATHRCGCRYRR